MDTNYKIITKPSLTYVIKGKKMSFFLQKINPQAPDVEKLYISWACINHADGEKNKQSIYNGPSGPKWLNAEWALEGTHTVVCLVRRSIHGKPERYEYVQRVISAKACLSYDTGSFEESGNPFNVLHNLESQIELIRALESKSKLSEEENTKYQERITNMETYRDKLKYLLEKIPDSHKAQFSFIAAKHYSGEYPDTNSITLQTCYFYADNTVYLLDWTNPVTQGWCGVFEGKGKDEKEAVLDALNSWRKNNRYPKGIMKCHYLYYSHPTLEIPKRDGEGVISWDIYDHNYWEKHEFATDGTTWLDDISNVLSWIAIGAAVVAGGILFFVPGGQAGTYVLWAIAASSIAATGAATINITQRYNTGFNNWKEDGLDALTVAASVLGLGSIKALTKWGPLAVLSKEAGNLGKVNAIKVMLIGQVAADSTQGIMISVDIASAIYSTAEDPTLPADEKLSRILRLLAVGVTTGALTYLNIKGTSANFSFLKEDHSLVRIMPKEEVDAMLMNPELFIIEHGERLPSTVTQSITVPKENVAIKQLQELRVLSSDVVTSPSPYIKNILIPNEQHLQRLTASYKPGTWLEKELNHYFMFNKPYDATQLSLRNPDTHSAIVPWSPMVRSSSQVSTKTVVYNQVKQEINHPNIAKLQQIARNSGTDPTDWKKYVALSRATCTIKGITFDNVQNFYNLPFDLNHAVNAGVVIKGEFTANSAPIKIVDIERYINTLEKYYPEKEMDELTKDLIEEYLVKHNGNLQNFYGMPGAHAEVVAVDDIFKQLREMKLDPKEYLSEIEVYTLKTNRPTKDEFLSEFPACVNCSGILDIKIQIHTGRVVE